MKVAIAAWTLILFIAIASSFLEEHQGVNSSENSAAGAEESISGGEILDWIEFGLCYIIQVFGLLTLGYLYFPRYKSAKLSGANEVLTAQKIDWQKSKKTSNPENSNAKI